MISHSRSSRLRYQDYRRHLKEQRGRDEQDGPPRDVPTGRRRPHQRSRSFFTLFREFIGLLGGHRLMLACILGALTFSTLLGLLPLYGTKLIIDNVLNDKPPPSWLPEWITLPDDPRVLLSTVAIGMISLTAVALSIGIWNRWQATRITQRMRVSVRQRVFDHAVRLPLHRVQALKSGGVASMLREDAGGVSQLIFAMIYNPWKAIIQLSGSLFILVTVDWRLLLGAMVLLPMVYLTHKTWISRIRPLYRDIRASRQYIDSRSTEAFSGMRVVRTFSRQRSESTAFTASNHFMTRQELSAWWWSRGVDILWSLMIPTATAGVLWYGGLRILHHEEMVAAGLMAEGDALTVGDLVMFVTYLGALLGPLQTLANSATQFQNSLAGLDRVLDILEEPREMTGHQDAVDIEPAQVAGGITLRNVSFTYPGADEPAVTGINLDVLPGQTVAFIGPSGAGKSTLCNLIARFYDPDEGTLALDGRDLRTINVESYRRLLGIVDQDIFLFDGSVAENIAYGKRHATEAQIIEAARRANAHEFIEQLADGYETHVGERGVKLSGGQRQRLAIARALLADPRILILDEATSNLDTESERLIQTSLAELMTHRTSFVIAHRLSTITHADQIVVIDHGRIIEQGRHHELMQQSGRYREMIRMQLAANEVPEPDTVDDADAAPVSR